MVMKAARFVMKCVALGLVVGAAACAIIAYWDKIAEWIYNVADKLEEKKAVSHCSEYDYYDDWESC